jgi:hypothetical protein
VGIRASFFLFHPIGPARHPAFENAASPIIAYSGQS